MRVHPREHHVVATAGKEQELTIWDLGVLLKGPETPKKGKGKKESKAPVEEKKGAPYKSKEILADGQIFKAKNVKNDHLDLRVPVWNTDLQFLNQFDITRIAVGTRHHQIRVYDTKGARRPAVDAEVGTMPVVALVNGKDASEVVFSDTVTNVYSVDTLTGAILGQYKGKRCWQYIAAKDPRLGEMHVYLTSQLSQLYFVGFTGVATAMAAFTPFEDSTTTHLVTVAMDRCLRVHEMDKTRKLLHKVYLKQRMTAVVVGEFTPYEAPEDEDETGLGARKTSGGSDDENDDDLWESMGKLEDKKLKKRKISKE